MEETHEYADSVFSESSSESSSGSSEPSENTFISNIELNESNTYSSEKEFIFAVKAYAKQEGFQVRLGESEKNSAGQIRKRTIICSREGKPSNSLKKRNRPSQRCNCQFAVRASLNSSNGLWYIIFLRLEHNHSMVSENSRRFMSEERTIPTEIQERILLLRRAGCNIPTIRAILKEEFSNIVTWIYDDLYNFIYQKEGTNREFDSNDFVKELERLKSQDNEFCYEILINPETNELQQAIWMFPEQKMNYCRFNDVVVFDNTYKTNRFGMPFGIFTGVNNHGQSVCFAGTIMCNESAESFLWTFNSFLKMVNNYSPKTLLTDEDQAIIKAVDLVFVPHGTKHTLCLWHLMKNLVKNLNGTLGFKWAEFIKFFYQCLDEYEEDEFLEKWNQLTIKYPSASKYLEKMNKNLKRWAPCYNRHLFMADMTTTQRGESMNSLMKGYMDATTSLTNFLKAFESALEQRKDDREFAKFYEDNKVISLLTANPHEKQASELLTRYAFKKTQKQLSQCMSYKSEKINR
jgi:zinc finger SWIM domain-containing protein 3